MPRPRAWKHNAVTPKRHRAAIEDSAEFSDASTGIRWILRDGCWSQREGASTTEQRGQERAQIQDTIEDEASQSQPNQAHLQAGSEASEKGALPELEASASEKGALQAPELCEKSSTERLEAEAKPAEALDSAESKAKRQPYRWS